ncbi:MULTISPECIES: hypothetical protein [Moorena]|uniref:Uncharacterized protein n=1 Tax=Moorena producens 3L TaxID=489825 RepID=F4XIN6_9CYAN|nr:MULTISPECIES: hypothetical protein [Moorena]EGJ35548.1 hypothetical protein LYNGBM3L_03210 [Moorena producens 3L]
MNQVQVVVEFPSLAQPEFDITNFIQESGASIQDSGAIITEFYS